LTSPLPDFFVDPFGDLPAQGQPGAAPAKPNAAPAAEAQPPAATPPAMTPQIQLPQMELPELPTPAIQTPEVKNDLRQPTEPQPAVPQPTEPPLAVPQPTAPQPVPIVPEIDQEPMELQPAPPAQVPPRREIEDFQMPRREEDRRPPSQLGAGSEDITLVRPVAYSCDDLVAGTLRVPSAKVAGTLRVPSAKACDALFQAGAGTDSVFVFSLRHTECAYYLLPCYGTRSVPTTTRLRLCW
jgi:hypothetical protein